MLLTKVELRFIPNNTSQSILYNILLARYPTSATNKIRPTYQTIIIKINLAQQGLDAH